MIEWHMASLAAPLRVVAYPRLRWFALAWLLVYIPVYAYAYGAWHFLFLCNLGVLTTACGLLIGSPLLLSSQAVAAPVVCLLWLADVGWKLTTGRYLHGGTAYMWDGTLPLAARVLSLYHAFWPLLLVYCLRTSGYDRRGFLIQVVLATASFMAALLIAPRFENINYVFRWQGAAVDQVRPLWHVAIMLGVLIAGVYWPMHRLLMLSLPALRPSP